MSLAEIWEATHEVLVRGDIISEDMGRGKVKICLYGSFK